MSALAYISLASSAVFGLLALTCFSLPILNALTRNYQGGPMFTIWFLLGGPLAILSVVHYGCYRYARIAGGCPAIRASLWCVVVVSVIAFALFVIPAM